MKYGFIIDNRKCIGCHACTVACKAEHDVAIGVNRTWVKQVEKGEYPNTRRLFSVMRCNHCTEAPCVEICPVTALFIREDGIVDFDNNRCIACKSCMQACPYDALYIDPNTHTAAKCNYCAHRVDIGLEPACVNVCPEHAIISGDMDDPNSEISQLLSREQVMVRKPEKGTVPNLFYIEGDESSLTPAATEKSDSYFWSAQSRGVGHFAKYVEQKAGQADLIEMARQLNGGNGSGNGQSAPKKSIEVLMEKSKRVYDAPDKGILWGWEVSGYVWTKAVAAGAFMVPFLASAFGFAEVSPFMQWTAFGLALVFLMLTTVLLVKDLDQPGRFVYVILRPQWRSWLVRGGYALTGYGGILVLWALAKWLGIPGLEAVAGWIATILAVITAIYTAFLFAQAKGRDFWQSPMLSLHMLGHSVLAGASALAIFSIMETGGSDWTRYLAIVMGVALVVNLLVMVVELNTTHPTSDAHVTAKMITQGRYRSEFWLGAIITGIVLPFILVLLGSATGLAVAGVLALIGMYFTEKIWVEAPQRIALS